MWNIPSPLCHSLWAKKNNNWEITSLSSLLNRLLFFHCWTARLSSLSAPQSNYLFSTVVSIFLFFFFSFPWLAFVFRFLIQLIPVALHPLSTLTATMFSSVFLSVLGFYEVFFNSTISIDSCALSVNFSRYTLLVSSTSAYSPREQPEILRQRFY